MKNRELNKEFTSLFKEAEKGMELIGLKLEFKENAIYFKGKEMQGTWQEIWQKLKKEFKSARELKRIETYKSKSFQSMVWSNQDERAFKWLDRNMMPEKVSAVMEVQEQMVETRLRIQETGRQVESVQCRLCGCQKETVQHWLAGCKILASRDYLKRHDDALKVFAVEWLKQEGLTNESTIWYNESWERGMVIENELRRLRWDHEWRTRTATTHRRPDLVLEYVDEKRMVVIDMGCPREENVCVTEMEKKLKYQQLCYELRVQYPGWTIHLIPLIVGCLGSVNNLEANISKVLEKRRVKWTFAEMQRVVVCCSETIVRKILSGLY